MADHLTVTSDGEAAVQVDGDVFGMAPVEIKWGEPKLALIVPEAYATDAAATSAGLDPLATRLGEGDQPPVFRIPQLQLRAPEALPQRDAVHVLQLRAARDAVAQPVVRDHAVEVVEYGGGRSSL